MRISDWSSDVCSSDRSFVTSINDNAESAAIVGAIARLGESLNLPITAEGIEDKAIAERVLALGCARGQGWLYGRPLHRTNVRKLLAERRLITSAAVPARASDNTEIGRAHVRTPVTNAHLVCRLLPEQQNQSTTTHHAAHRPP